MRRPPLFVAAWNAAFLLPVVVLILGAVSARWTFPNVIPEAYNGRGLLFLVRNAAGISTSLASSFAYSIAVVLLSALLCVLPASVLARYEFRGRVLLEAVLLSPVLIPAIAYAMGIHFVLIRLGLADTAAGVILILTAAAYPYMLRSLVAGFQGIDPNFEACARNLGAGPFRRLLLVHVPLLAPALVAGGSIVFLVAFSEYFLVFLVGGGAVKSFTGYLFPFLTAADIPIASALTLTFLAVPLVLFAVIDRAVLRFYRRRGIE